MNIFLYLMSALLILAGINHFRKPKVYLRMMPPFLPNHVSLNYLSGVAEIIFGVGLLITEIRNWSAWGIILLFIAIFPANIYMLTSGKFNRIPKWVLWLRLPLQIVLIWWAYQYT